MNKDRVSKMSNPTIIEEPEIGGEEDYTEDFEASQSEQVTSIFSEDDTVSRDDHPHLPTDKSKQKDPPSESQLSQGVPDELKGLTRYLEGGEEGESNDVSVSISQSQEDSNKTNTSKGSKNVEGTSEETSIENILEKLNRLSNAQLALESVLDAEGALDDKTLQEAIHNARRHVPEFNSVKIDEDEELSLINAEFDALQKLTEREKDKPEDNNGRWKDSEIQRIFKQYDELENSLASSVSRHSGGEEDESLKSLRSNTGEVPAKSRIPEVTSTEPLMTKPSTSSSFKTPISDPGHTSQVLTSIQSKPKPYSSPDPASFKEYLKQPNYSSHSMSSSSSLTMTDGLRSPIMSKRNKGGYGYSATPQELSHKKSIELQKTPPTTPPSKSLGTFAKESVSEPGLGDRPITPSNLGRSSRTIASPRRKIKPGGSQHVPSSGREGRGEGQHLEEENLRKIKKLEGEIARQETLLDAYQQDNQKLYNELKACETEHTKKEAEWEDLTNSLKTEVATLKINRLVPMINSPSRPGSAQKAELERLREEATVKSQQIIELKREMIVMRNKQAESAKPIASKQGKASLAYQQREKESQKTIRGLSKQVRTLQNILYRKDPAAATALAKATSRDDLNSSRDRLNSINSDRNDAHVAVLESRITELEKDLEKADDEAKNRLKDFQARLNGLKGKYEDQIKDYEMRLEDAAGRMELLENNVSQATILEFKNRFDKSQLEISHLKQDINRYKRELEIAQKSSVSTAVSQATVKQDAGTLSLAIKTFKSELSDKEKEIIRMKKEIADLNRTTTTLKRERERYLNLANALNIPGSVPSNPRIVPRTMLHPLIKPTKEKDSGSLNIRSPIRNTTNASQATSQMLQSALEYERTEFEQLLENKRKELIERDQIIVKLKQELEELRHSHTKYADEVDESSRSHMLNELRARVSTQNELIHKLKDHVTNYRRIEGEYLLLKQENGQMEVKIKELKQKLAITKTLNKPETEVLELLSNKLDELNSRYLNREGQMMTLLHRMTVKTGSNVLSPRLGLSSGSNLDMDTRRSELDLRQLSPTFSMHLLNASSFDAQE